MRVEERGLPIENWLILGFGEAASTLVSAGFPLGVPVAVYFPSNRPPTAADRVRLELCSLPATDDPAAIRQATVVLSLVTPGAAVVVAESVLAHLKPGTIYVDANSISSDTAVEIGRLIEDRGARFVDAAIMGPVPLLALEVPIWLSGEAAGDFHLLAGRRGLSTKVVSPRAGDASALKMLWSVLTKGTIALLAESLTAAHRMNLLPPVMELLAKEYGTVGTPVMILRMLRSTAASGARRLEEMREAARTLRVASVPAWTVEATARWIAVLAGVEEAIKAETVSEVVEAISNALGAQLDAVETRARECSVAMMHGCDG